jgi:hypothetical protein
MVVAPSVWHESRSSFRSLSQMRKQWSSGTIIPLNGQRFLTFPFLQSLRSSCLPSFILISKNTIFFSNSPRQCSELRL